MEENKYFRGLSDYELDRMIHLDMDRYTKQELAQAADEIERRAQVKAPSETIAPPEPAAPASQAAPTEETQAADTETPEDSKANALSFVDVQRIRRLTYNQLSDMIYIHASQYTKAERDIAFNELCLRGEAEIGEQNDSPADEDGIGFEGDKDNPRTGMDDRDEDGLPLLDTDDEWTESSTIRCSACGRELPRDAKYCLDCGRKVTDGGDRFYGKHLTGIVFVVAVLFIALLRACR